MQWEHGRHRRRIRCNARYDRERHEHAQLRDVRPSSARLSVRVRRWSELPEFLLEHVPDVSHVRERQRERVLPERISRVAQVHRGFAEGDGWWSSAVRDERHRLPEQAVHDGSGGTSKLSWHVRVQDRSHEVHGNMPVAWTSAARALVPPRRPSDGTFALNEDAAWKRMREIFAMIEGAIADGMAHPPTMDELEVDLEGTKRAFARLQNETIPKKKSDHETEACLSTLLTYTCWASYQTNVQSSLLRYWIATHGPAFAVEMLHHTGTRRWLLHAKTLTARVIIPAHWKINEENLDYDYGVLRAWLAHANEDDHARALDAAKAMWPKALLGVRCVLAYAFPEREDWADEAFEAVKMGAKEKGRVSPTAQLLYGTKRDPKFLAKLYALAGLFGDAQYMLVDTLGVEATPILIQDFGARTKHYKPKDAQKMLLSAMTMIESKEMAAFFSDQLELKSFAKIAEKYLRRVPDLALPILSRSTHAAAKKLYTEIKNRRA